MRSFALLGGCLLLVIGGCSGDAGSDAEGQARKIRELREANDSLERHVDALSDSLAATSARYQEATESLRTRGTRDSLLRRSVEELLLNDRVGVWAPGEEATSIHFAEPVDSEDVSDLVAAFNRRFSDPFFPELRLQSIQGSVAHVGVSDEQKLTEQMGSTGSAVYLSAMTYTLTSLPQIDSVYLDIAPGSHARPRTYTRSDWLQWVSFVNEMG